MDDEDDEMKQAMQMSLGDSSSSTSPHPLSQYMQPPRPPTPNPNFGPSNKDGSNLGLGLVRMPDAVSLSCEREERAGACRTRR